MRDWIVQTTSNLYVFLLPFSWGALAIAAVVLLPLAAWRKTRGSAGAALYIISFIIGATTWCLGAAITFSSYGWFGLIIGLFIMGIGVVPLGIIGAFFKLGISALGWSLCGLLVITLVTRFAGVACAVNADKK
jgi:hypothetical protein